MDRITKSLLGEFCSSNEIDALEEDVQFERFAAYLAMTRYLDETADIEEVMVGGSRGGDTGIDAIGTIVNGALVTDPELVTELVGVNGFVEATFLFVQADRGASFQTTKIGQFAFGVNDFFAQEPTLARNAEVEAASEIMNEVYRHSSKFRRNPDCRLFYVTTGKWTGDHDLEARRAAAIADLKELGIFASVEFTPLGADDLRNLYAETKSAISREFMFPSRTVVPEIVGVKEAYIGLLPATEFIALVDDGDGRIVRGIFYDNVRDWQDYNAVNKGIRETLESDIGRSRFALMNNGITIIAKSLTVTGHRFHMDDYQIVNGGQTSHVLHDCRELLDESVYVPLRIIATSDEDVIAAVVRATNRQTEVKEEQLLALSDFQKKLKAYFATFDPPERLYYERRSRQYNSMPEVEKTRIVTLQSVVRSYASVFLQEPHRTTRNYSALREQLGTTIFGNDHKLAPYYYSAALLYRLEFLFRNNQLESKFKPARYHILMAARMLATSKEPPLMNSNAMDKYCEQLIAQLWKPGSSERLLRQAASIVEKAAAGNFDRDVIRTQPFTESVRGLARARRAKPQPASR